jgi:hypothetical protein
MMTPRNSDWNTGDKTYHVKLVTCQIRYNWHTPLVCVSNLLENPENVEWTIVSVCASRITNQAWSQEGRGGHSRHSFSCVHFSWSYPNNQEITWEEWIKQKRPFQQSQQSRPLGPGLGHRWVNGKINSIQVFTQVHGKYVSSYTICVNLECRKKIWAPNGGNINTVFTSWLWIQGKRAVVIGFFFYVVFSLSIYLFQLKYWQKKRIKWGLIWGNS